MNRGAVGTGIGRIQEVSQDGLLGGTGGDSSPSIPGLDGGGVPH